MSRLLPRLRRALLALGGALLILRGTAASGLGLSVAGPEFIVFDQRTQACDTSDLPDAPARAFRNAQGQMVLFAPNFRNRAFEGPDLRHLARDCAVRFAARQSADPGQLDDRTWLHAFHTTDGTHIFALASASFIPYRHGEACAAGRERTACWSNGIAALSSQDGGRSFSYTAPPPRHVLMPPQPFTPQVRDPAGFVSATNIVSYKGDLYSIVWRREADGKRSRNCLVRAPGGDVRRWEMWTGEGFAPMAQEGPAGWQVEGTDCAAIGRGLPAIRGLVLHPASSTFIAVFQMRPRGPTGGEDGFYTATSKDMVTWSPPRLLLAQPLRDGLDDHGTFAGYPTLIDDKSPDRDFGTVGPQADLVFVRFMELGAGGPKGRNRQLVAVPLRITP